jgi:ABC-2 type transport system permease protein
LFLEIPSGFEKKIIKNNLSDAPALFLTMNAIDGTKAGLGMYYANSIISDFNLNLIKDKKIIPDNQILLQTKSINIDYSNWYNPELNYKTFMLPGILVLLVTMIGAFLSAMNVVREKEIGTIDQINVTPIKKYQFIIGKLTPLWLLAMFELAFGLSISLLIYDIPFLGSIFVLFSFAAVYILACVGLGLLISTISDNQQQAMFVTWFFMVIFILLSGLFTAIESMPLWVQYITYFNPIRYFIEVVRLVMLKGSGFSDISRQFIIISIFAVSINLLAVMRYKKVSS